MRRRPGDPWEYNTDIGVLTFDPVEELFDQILKHLRRGKRSAWDLEGPLAVRFDVGDRERKAMLRNGHRAWENHVAWALSRLSRQKRVTKCGSARTEGGYRGIYQANF
jgi:hypothetical protein